MQGMTSAQDSDTDLKRLNKALDKSLELLGVGKGGCSGLEKSSLKVFQ